MARHEELHPGGRQLSVVLPARNEAEGLRRLLPALRAALPEAEVIVVDDGSSDQTATVAREHGCEVLDRPQSMGNGAAIKQGAGRSRRDILVFMDADGQHRPEDLPGLLAQFGDGYDMVVGARPFAGQASLGRGLANWLYNRLASYMVGRPIPDLTSGFRVVDRRRFLQFVHLLPNGFSYPTTITMAFFRAGYAVGFRSIGVSRRQNERSHIRPLRDGVRFLAIIFKVATLYSPLKIFLPVAAIISALGVGYSVYTLSVLGRFTNMGALLLLFGTLVFLIGLLSEQMTMLLYQGARRRDGS